MRQATSPTSTPNLRVEPLALCGGKVTGSVLRRTLLLTVRPEDTHFWSPHLDVQLEATAGGTRL